MNIADAKTPLSAGCRNTIRHIAFDGCRYVCTLPSSCALLTLDSALRPLEKKSVCRSYSCLCFDWHERCFWASAAHCPGFVYKLSPELDEIDCIRIRSSIALGPITGMTCGCCTGGLTLAFAHAAAAFDVQTGRCEILLQRPADWICGVLQLRCGLLVTVLCGCRFFCVLYDSDGKAAGRCELKTQLTPVNFIVNPCSLQRGEAELFALKCGCYPYLLHCTLPWACACPDCPVTCPCPEPETQPCCDVIRSVACMETALSGILHAEGQKLTRVIAESSDLDTILCANKQVTDTLVRATHLEQVLYDKLAAAVSCCGEAPACQ